jgi:hypothetical protein
VYGEGRRLTTYATDREALGGDDTGHAPTRLVAPDGEQ